MAASADAQVPVYEFDGIAPGDCAAHCVVGVGDVNGDGWGTRSRASETSTTAAGDPACCRAVHAGGVWASLAAGATG